MRNLLLLSILFFCLVGTAAASTPELSVSAPTSFTGTPLRIEAGVSGQRGVRADIFLDGKKIGSRSLSVGAHELVFDDVELSTGSHQVQIRSASISTQTTFRVYSGWLTILPPLIAIILALISRDVIISLFLGLLSGAAILSGGNLFTAFARSIDKFIVEALADGDHASILIFTTLLGGLVGVITKSGGTHGIVESLKPYATSRRRGQLATWAMGFMVFFDDYANTLIVGPTMRPITDRLRISREKLAYIVDSTAAPVVCLFPISTWVGFEIGLIGDAFKQLDLPYDAYSTFVASIPYRFYPIFALFLVFMLAFLRRDFGPMRVAETRAREEGLVLAVGARPIADYSSGDTEPPADIPKRPINAVLPLVIVVAMTLIGLWVTGSDGLHRAAGDSFPTWIRKVLENANSYTALLWASLSGAAIALILPLAQRILKVQEAMTALVAGCKAMFMAFMVLVLAWSLSAACGELHTADFMVGLATGSMSAVWLPAITFLMSAAIAFATGSSWGTMAIIEPLVIPICHSLALQAGHEVTSPGYSSLMLASVASVLTGSVWGDHCSPISDTTILSSMASGCDHIAHVKTQAPYAIAAGLVAIGLGSFPAALGWSPWLSLLLGFGVIVAGIQLLGRRQGPPPEDRMHEELAEV